MTFIFFLIVTIFSFTVQVNGAEVSALNREKHPQAEFAGIWFYSTIEQDTTKKQFPVGYVYGPSATDEVGKDQLSSLHKRMKDALRKAQKQKGTRILDYMPEDESDLASSLTDDSIVFACAFNYEHVESQYVSGAGSSYSKIMAEIGFDLVICNFKDRRILAILPARVVVIDAVSGRASSEKKNSMLKYLYEQKMIPEFIKLASAPYCSAMATETIGIRKLRIDDKALASMPINYKVAGERSYKGYFSSLISSSFYEQIKVPVLPYSGGGDKIYYVMSERIKDTARVSDEAMADNNKEEQIDTSNCHENVKDFILKKPTYTLDVVIPGYMTHTLQSNNYQKEVAFIAYCGVRLHKNGQEIYVRKFQDAVTAVYPTTIECSSPWLNYEDAMIKIFRSTASALRKNKKTQYIIKQVSTPN